MEEDAVRVASSLAGPGSIPEHRTGTRLLACLDVEWSKNYRIRDGNLAFCYSVVWLAIPDGKRPAKLAAGTRFDYTSVYLDHDDERRDLVEHAATDIAAALTHADLLTGHQLCSDLAVLEANTRTGTPAAVTSARAAWAGRRQHGQRRVLDTRFDAGHLLTGTSRRLVDVCGELDLDVTQPELARKSMTALHRDWLHHGDTEARERVAVLNLRHSLSTTLVAALAAGAGRWQAPLNVNVMLARQLRGTFDWLNHPTFRSLHTIG